MKESAKKDIAIIMAIGLFSAILYIALEGVIMGYGKSPSNPLLLKFLPFQEMFLTLEILKAPIPFNILGYFVIALVCAIIAITMHGEIYSYFL